MPEQVGDELVVATITIRRLLVGDQDLVSTDAVDAADEPLALVEALGLLRLAEDTVIREAMGEDLDDEDTDDDDDEDDD